MNHNLGQGQFIEIRKVSGTARSEARMLSVSFLRSILTVFRLVILYILQSLEKKRISSRKNHILNGQDLRRYYLVLKQL